MDRAIARNFVRFAGVFIAASLWTAAARADGTWSGGAGSPYNWSASGNWSSGNASGNVTFTTSNGLNNTNDRSGLSLSSITFNSAAGSFILNGNQFTLTGNISDQISNVAQTINNNILLGGSSQQIIGVPSQTYSNNLTLNMNGVIDDGGAGRGITVTVSGSYGAFYLTLAGANTFSGKTNIIGNSTLGAWVMLANPLALQNSTVVLDATYPSNSNLNFGTLTQATLGGLSTPSGASTISLTNTNNLLPIALTVGGNGASTTAAGVITGAGALTKIGTGILTLSATNTFTGGTLVSAGTLTLANALALQNSTFDTTGAGSLVFSGITSATFGGLQGTGTLNLQNTALAGVALTVGGNNASTTCSGSLTGAGASLTKSGSGTLTLSGTNNTYDTGTTVSGGFLQFGTAGSIPSSGSITVKGAGALLPTLPGGPYATAGGWLNSGKISTSSTGAIAIAGSDSEVINLSTSGYTGLYLCGTVGGSTYSGTLTATGSMYRLAGGPSSGGTLTVTSTLGDVNSVPTGLTAGIASGTTLFLSGSNTYSGGTILAAGILSVSADSNLGNSNGGLAFNGGTLQITGTALHDFNTRSNFSSTNVNWSTFTGGFDITDAGNTFTISQSIQGTGSLTKNGAGTLVLSGPSNTYTGATTLNAGQLTLKGTLGAATAITVNGGVLDLWGNTQNTTAAVYLAGCTVQNGTIGLNVASKSSNYFSFGSGTTTISAALTGTAGLNLASTAASTVILTGTNTFTGSINVSLGNTLQIGTGGTAGSISSTSGSTMPSMAGSVVFDRSDAYTYSGAVSPTGTAAQVIQAGAGALTISGAVNAASGTKMTFQVAGTMIIANDISVSGGTLTKTGTGTLILASTGAGNNSNMYATPTIAAGTLQIGTGATVGALSSAGNSSLLGSTNLTDNGLLVVNRADAVKLGGSTLSGTGGLVKQGTGALTISNATTFTGTTMVSTGTLLLSNALALQNSTFDTTGAGTASFGTLMAVTFGGLQGASGTLSLLNTSSAAVALSVGNNGFNTTYSGVISDGGSLIKIGTGTFTLAGTNTFGGGVTLSAGQLNINNTAALGTGTFTISGGTIDNTTGSSLPLNNNPQNWNGTFAFVGSNPLDLGTGAVTLGSNLTVTLNGSALTVGGSVGGAYGLTKAGTGTLVLANTQNGYSGGTILAGGELSISAAGCVGSGTLAFNGGTLKITGTTMTSIASVNWNWDIFTGGFDIDDPNNTFSVNYSISSGAADGGKLTKSGPGTLVLCGNYSTYTGGTLVTAGTLQLGNGATNGSAGGAGGNGGDVALSLGTTLVFDNPGSPRQDGVISGSGNLVKMGAGTLTLTGSNTYDHGTLISTGTLRLGNGGTTGSITGDVTNNASLVFYRSNTATFTGTISGTGAVTQAGGGTLVLSGSTSTYTGGTFVTAGTLQVGDGSGQNGSLGGLDTQSGSATVSAGATLAFANSTAQTYSGVISGSGDVVKSGVGMLVLSGSNAFTGATTVTSNGRITLGNALALQNSTLDYGSYGGTLSFGTLTEATLGGLQGTNFHNELVDTRLSLSDSVGAVALTVGNNSQSTTFSGAIIGSGSLIKVGTGTLTLSGTNTYSGGTTVAGGTLDISTLDSLPSGTTLTMAGSAAVVFANDLGGAIELDLLSIDLSEASGSPMYTFEVFSKGTVSGQSPASEVPEPGTMVLLAAAAAAAVLLAAWRRRRRDWGLGIRDWRLEATACGFAKKRN